MKELKENPAAVGWCWFLSKYAQMRGRRHVHNNHTFSAAARGGALR